MLANLSLYGLVGGISAGLHALVLVCLPRLGVPLPIANLTGFLVASLWSYLAHSKVSFRKQTKGKVFPRRWLLLQLALNVVLSLLLPAVFAPWAKSPMATLILVFTPTAVNYGVWSFAANHVVRLQPGIGRRRPDCHADDLGLDEAINDAIFDLADAGQLQGASLMVAGPAVAHAMAGLRGRPGLKVYLHLVLSEGPPISAPAEIPLLVNGQGYLNLGFGQLLLAKKAYQQPLSPISNRNQSADPQISVPTWRPIHLPGWPSTHSLGAAGLARTPQTRTRPAARLATQYPRTLAHRHLQRGLG